MSFLPPFRTPIADSNGTFTGQWQRWLSQLQAIVNPNPGSFTNADITVNAQGQITAASNGSGGGSGSPGGSNGQVQYNNAGAFGGFFVGGDGTLNATTGNLVISKTVGVPFAASATTNTTTTANIIDSTNKRFVTDAQTVVLTNTSGTNTGDQTNITGNASTATELATARTISVTGDMAYTSPSFDGSSNVTAAGTLAIVNSNVGSFTNANITVNAKGLITAASTGAGGTVTSASVVSANGFAGTVATATTTPAITLSTSVTGILQGNGTAISAATTSGSGSVVLATSPSISNLQGSVQTGGSGTAALMGVQFLGNGTAGNNATVETTLKTTTLPANAFGNNVAIRVIAYGVKTSNIDTKTLKLYFGSTVILTQTLAASNTNTWAVEALVVGTGASAQDWAIIRNQDGTTVNTLSSGSSTEAGTSSIVVKLTGTASGPSDILCHLMAVEFLN